MAIYGDEKTNNDNCETTIDNSIEFKYENATELLKAVLTESGMENEFDEDIYNFLKNEGELPKDYEPYWS